MSDRQQRKQAAAKAVDLAMEIAGGRAALAEAADVSERSISRYRACDTLPAPDVARRIHEATDVPLAAIRPDIWAEEG